MAVPPVAALLLPLLLLPEILTEKYEFVPIEIMVVNSLGETPTQSYKTSVVKGGILLGAMNRLMSSNTGFKFTCKKDPNFGPFLLSVNGLFGSDTDHTYWELLVRTASGEIKRPDVGIGCYIPQAHEQIILNFSKW